MENMWKSRQNIKSVKKQASIFANRARYLAQILNEDDKIVRKINTLEQKIQNTILNRNNAKNFCGKEIEQLQLTLSDLEKRFTRKVSRSELTFSLFVIFVNIFVFVGYYSSSIPKDIYHISPNFYFILAILTSICLAGIFFFYFRAYKWLLINIIFPFLGRIKSSNQNADLFFRWSTEFFIGSMFTFLYRVLVIACATTVPIIFSPSMSIVLLLSNIWAVFEQIFISSPLVAIATFFTILPFIVSLLKKIFKLLQ